MKLYILRGSEYSSYTTHTFFITDSIDQAKLLINQLFDIFNTSPADITAEIDKALLFVPESRNKAWRKIEEMNSIHSNLYFKDEISDDDYDAYIKRTPSNRLEFLLPEFKERIKIRDILCSKDSMLQCLGLSDGDDDSVLNINREQFILHCIKFMETIDSTNLSFLSEINGD